MPNVCEFGSNSNLGQLFMYLTCLIQKTVIPLLFAIAMVIFIWGVVQFVINGDDAEKKEKGRTFMIWGIIGLTVMVGVWGLVGVVARTFGINGSVLPQLPNGSNSSYNQNTVDDNGNPFDDGQ